MGITGFANGPGTGQKRHPGGQTPAAANQPIRRRAPGAYHPQFTLAIQPKKQNGLYLYRN